MSKLSFLCLLCFFCFHHLYAKLDDSWFDHVKNRTDPEAIEWLREKIKMDLSSSKLSLDASQPCKNCLLEKIQTIEPKIYVFMSFSVPDETWLSLGKELEKNAGVFVLRGLPNNSFQELARRIAQLKKKGLNAEIQLNPLLFKEFGINAVPAFLTSSQELIKGNISLEYALQKTGQI